MAPYGIGVYTRERFLIKWRSIYLIASYSCTETCEYATIQRIGVSPGGIAGVSAQRHLLHRAM